MKIVLFILQDKKYPKRLPKFFQIVFCNRTVKHIVWSYKLTQSQNQSKSLPTQTHSRQKQCSKLIEKSTESKEYQAVTRDYKTLRGKSYIW